ncbi:MAG: aminopeptidase N [Oligoflexia bacterium]|nr:aminopeptidase N [Oligoflexia bacterium]
MKTLKLIQIVLLISMISPLVLASDRVVSKGLTQEIAEARASVIKAPVKYDLTFVVGQDEKEFTGISNITFDIISNPEKLTLDFFEGKVQELTINGVVQPIVEYNNHFITLPVKSLKTGTNNVIVKFSHVYSTSGTGLHRFLDPEDKRVYMYTHLEPYDANQVFPCFDQPDLKAIITMQVTAPKDWTVISTTREEKTTAKENKMTQWNFTASPVMSTYLMSLHAGPYKMWNSQAGAVPLRLFARQSLAKYVVPNDWFTITRQGLKFFDEYFAFPYPFKKYDQVIAPDFNMGAMENLAAVTFSELYIQRGKSTQSERLRLAEVILHEMAHMWFGDLVTMKWWNDLWLNESFATYMATIAINEATEFKKLAWVNFFFTKIWAYTEDQWVTTHPIEGPVRDSESAFVAFDGITYGKGASSLKQIDFYLGEDNFKKGVRLYFQKYQYRNTERKDFTTSLAVASGKDLKKWTTEWLQKEGLNTVEIQYTCKNDKIQNFRLIQTAPSDHSTLRSHRTQIAMFMSSGPSAMKMYKVVQAHYEGKETVIKELEKQDCPDIAFPNYGDFDYVKVKLDKRTLENTQKYLTKIDDPLTRLQLWSTLWDMVRDGELDAPSYANFVFDNLGSEKDIKIIELITNTLYGRRLNNPSLQMYLPKEEKEARAYFEEYTKRAEDFFWKQTQKAPAGSDLQKTWFGSYLRVAKSIDAQLKLVKVLKNEIKFKNFPIDQDRRWKILFQLALTNAPGVNELLTQESKDDPSNAGLLMSIYSDAAKPDRTKKKEWFEKITAKPNEIPLNQARFAMNGLFPPDQANLKAEFADAFFTVLPKINNEFSPDFQETFASTLAPNLCTQESAKKLENYLDSKPTLTPVILKELLVVQQEDERCVKVRKIASDKLTKIKIPKK